MSRPYDFGSIESKWQSYWHEHQTFRTPDPGDANFDPQKPKYYVLDMFPYPSGAGLHVGHPLGYIATDIVTRYKRMTGFNVLHPMGFDAFGLPAEQYAVEHGIHPEVTTKRNIETMRRQLKGFGLSYDWNREISTTDREYYRWTQWIFLQLYKSYFDPGLKKARPLSELVAKLAANEWAIDAAGRPVPRSGNANGLRLWSALSEGEQANALDACRLAYLTAVPVNWCPALGTVLANEEVTADGRSERGNHPVYTRPLKQWMLRITAYADRLLEDLNLVDWPESIKIMQRNWIGRSEGAMVDFRVAESDAHIRVFTTRPDTLFGATYMVLAPEHPLVHTITKSECREGVQAYVAAAKQQSEADRGADATRKTGVFTGAHALNPVSGERIPIWVADYVLMGYGSGAIMAVPGHDERDFAFAVTFTLPIRPVVEPTTEWLHEQARAANIDGSDERIREEYNKDPGAFGRAYSGAGQLINSANDEISLNGSPVADAIRSITTWLEKKHLGTYAVQYKLRDWLFSRQRYWGEPFPLLHRVSDGRIRAVTEAELPVELPSMEDFRPPINTDPTVEPQPTLSRAPESWKSVEIEGQAYRRELNTMPQWAGSCWYYLRFIDPRNAHALVDPQKERYWMGQNGIDLYVGGAEHAVLHLLYARFWHKVLYDLGHISTPEPFGRLFNQGYISAYAYQDERGIYVPAAQIEERDGQYFYKGQAVKRVYGKMGKSLKNAVNPDEMFAQFGCDTLRLYEMYLGPLDTSKPWSTRDIVGVHRFLQRVWRNFFPEGREDDAPAVSEDKPREDLLRALHQTIKRTTEDMDRMHFNTAIAALIEFNNRLIQEPSLPRDIAEPLVLMLAPIAPHMAEELWRALGHQETLAYETWPTYDEKLLVQEEQELVVQIKGKTRARIRVRKDAAKEAIEKAALADETVIRHLEGSLSRKFIHVPGRLVNIIPS